MTASRRSIRVAAIALVALVALVASALAATGELTPRGCIEDTGQDECAKETAGLDGANSVAISADGKSVYAASLGDDAIVRLKRDKTTGALTRKGCVEDTGQDECGKETVGLDIATAVAISPDGRSVYAASLGDDAIVRLKRNTTTGALTPKGCIEDSGQDECAVETAGLGGATSVAVSADGKSVYVASVSDDAIVRFKRNRKSGALRAQDCVDDAGLNVCDQGAAGLADVSSVAVSADGRSLYAAGFIDDTIVRFKRNRTTGALIPMGCIEDAGLDECAGETAGLDGAESVAVSPDGRSVYVASFEDGAIVRFERNKKTGVLTPQGCVEDMGQAECDEETAGLGGVESVAVSADGKSLYAASPFDSAIVPFKRNKTSGTLSAQGCIEDTGQDECAEETEGLDGAISPAISADGKSVYVAGTDDNAIVRFKRER